jgi:adenine-specific DNA-methyltransferase
LTDQAQAKNSTPGAFDPAELPAIESRLEELGLALDDYVDDTDAYRHSKRLAFMERRLKLAKELLNPDDSVLIVTIDEKEYLRLGLLLEQTFPGARVQMVSTTINPRSTSRANDFSRVDEFAFFVFIGSSGPVAAAADSAAEEVRWFYLRRTQRHLVRGSRPNQFYPIYVDAATSQIVKIGEPMGRTDRIEDVPVVDGAVAVSPVNPDGEQLIWGLTGPSLRQALRDGYLWVTPGTEHQPYTISYLSLPNTRRAELGELEVTRIRPDGSKVVVLPRGRAAKPTTVWREARHDAGAYGTSLLRSLVPGRRFPFPKSLYLVEDTLRLFVKDKPDAVVLDFFAGSGTTAHAVARLNRQDGGRRKAPQNLESNGPSSVSSGEGVSLPGRRGPRELLACPPLSLDWRPILARGRA